MLVEQIVNDGDAPARAHDRRTKIVREQRRFVPAGMQQTKPRVGPEPAEAVAHFVVIKSRTAVGRSRRPVVYIDLQICKSLVARRRLFDAATEVLKVRSDPADHLGRSKLAGDSKGLRHGMTRSTTAIRWPPSFVARRKPSTTSAAYR
jgi:hypothetical protein